MGVLVKRTISFLFCLWLISADLRWILIPVLLPFVSSFLAQPRTTRTSDRKNARSLLDFWFGSDAYRDEKNDTTKRGAPPANGRQVSPEPEEVLETKKAKKGLKLSNHIDGTTAEDTLHLQATRATGCSHTTCAGSLMRVNKPENSNSRTVEEVLAEAKDFFNQYYGSLKMLNSEMHQTRWSEVEASVKKTGSYRHTYEELVFGTKTAWRNAQRCIGRISWTKLRIIDGRDAKSPRDMYEKLVEHMKYAANDGNLRSVITLFPPRQGAYESDFRIWNAQLVRYAGYKQPDGSILGDPASVEFTDVCLRLGCSMRHLLIGFSRYPAIADLGLKWYGLPAVSGMIFDCGGILFPGTAFNGWYLSTEIARDLCDANRYNAIQDIANAIGLDTRNVATLWKDTAFLECNRAVLHSFQMARVTIVDQHTVSESFIQHMETEQVWLVPPMGGSLLTVFHQEMLDYRLAPCFDYQVDAWKVHPFGKPTLTQEPLEQTMQQENTRTKAEGKLLILYATETGKSAKFAENFSALCEGSFDVKLHRMDEYDLTQLHNETTVIMIASTTGNGDPPENGARFAEYLDELYFPVASTARRRSFALIGRRKASVADYMERKIINPTVTEAEPKALRKPASEITTEIKHELDTVKYAVFGLGSSAYKYFCGFAFRLDEAFRQLGAEPLLPIQTGNDLNLQEETFRKWAYQAYTAACQSQGITPTANLNIAESVRVHGNDSVAEDLEYRLVEVLSGGRDLTTELGMVHKLELKNVALINRMNLQSPESPRKTLQLTLEGTGALGYKPGDHLAIFPKTDGKMLAYLFQRLGLDFESSPTVQLELMDSGSRSWKPVNRLPTMSLKAIFGSFLDVITPPSQQFLGKLAKFAKDPTDQRMLTSLSQDEKEYEKWKTLKWPSLSDTLEEFSSVNVELTVLLADLPLIQPRFYSVSTSPLINSSQVELTVGVFESTDQIGRKHGGLCTGYLSEIPIGEEIPVYVRSAPSFHLPPDLSVPIYMICAGTGIAPFRSFWQQFEALRNIDTMQKLEPHLIFGCRSSKLDHIYQAEIDVLLEKGFLNSFHLALSREPGNPKTYVQQLLVTFGEKLMKDIRSRHAHIYVCGEVSMATSVWDTIEDLCIAIGGMDEDQAEDFMDSMRASNRYHEDIFGTYHHLPAK